MKLDSWHVPEWDRVNPGTQIPERAILDVLTRDPRTGLALCIDARVTSELSAYPARLRARANNDGSAVADSAAEKRRRYPPSKLPHATLLPFVLEAGGRASEEAAAMVRYWGARSGDPATVTPKLWQSLSTTLQVGNAESIMSALGPQRLV